MFDILKNKCPHTVNGQGPPKPPAETPLGDPVKSLKAPFSSGSGSGSNSASTPATGDASNTSGTASGFKLQRSKSTSKKITKNPYSKEEFERIMWERQMAEQERLIQRERDRVKALEFQEKKEREALKKKQAAEAEESAQKRRVFSIVQPVYKSKKLPGNYYPTKDEKLGSLGGAEIDFGFGDTGDKKKEDAAKTEDENKELNDENK